jgi:hypothetical protein
MPQRNGIKEEMEVDVVICTSVSPKVADTKRETMKKRNSGQLVSVFSAFCLVGAALSLLGACGDDNPGPSVTTDASAGDVQQGVQRGALHVSSSDPRGFARVGTANVGSNLLLLDAKTQRPVRGARVEAVEDEDGFLVRVSRDEDAYEPEVVRMRRGANATVTVNPATADVRGQALSVGVQVMSEDFLGEGDINIVLAFAKTESRPSVMFLPALASDVSIGTQRFKVYKATLPGTLLAILSDGSAAPANGSVVRSRSQVVGTQGISRAGVPVGGNQVQSAARSRPGPLVLAPVPKAVSVTAPDATGAAVLSWSVDDSMAVLLGFDVGIDTTVPNKRVGKTVRSLPISVLRGEHFACVRAVFDGSDVEPKLDCVNFDAPLAPAAANVRVTVRRLPSTATMPIRARQPVAVELEVENTGDTSSAALDVAVVVSRDGRTETGEGETRLLRVDGIPAKGRARRVATVIPSRDGAMFVAAQADPKALLKESNAKDNGARMPLQVEAAGTNRAPVLSMTPVSEGGAVKRGRPLPLNATAYDPEEGDISNRIVWTSTIDGYLGQGGSPTSMALSVGRHRLRATIKDQGIKMVPAPLDNALLPGKGYGYGLLWPLRQTPIWAAAIDESEQVVGETEIEVVDETLPTNSAPTVSAGPDLTTSVGVAVSPLATASDEDSDPLIITWKAKLATTEEVLVDASSLSPSFIPPAAGEYRLMVQVSDGKSTAFDEMVVNVVADNAAPTIEVVLPPKALVGMPVFANVQATDSNGDPLTIGFELLNPQNSEAFVLTEEGMPPSFVPDVPGLYTFIAFADDGRGGKIKGQAEVFAAGDAVPDAGVVQDAATILDAKPVVPDAPLAMNIATGSSCKQSVECSSGFCVDGVCCSTACVGLCESCAIPGMQGACTASAVGTGGDGDCPMGSSCNAVHQCGPFLVKPGSNAIAQGNVSLLGRGTWNPMSDDQRQRATCDPVSRLCLLGVSSANQSTSATVWVVSLDNPKAAPIVLPVTINPGDWRTGFQSGVVMGVDTGGISFAWKPGWQSPQYLTSGSTRECKASPDGLSVACLTNEREDATGSTVDITVGPLANGGSLPAVIGTAHYELQGLGNTVEMTFTADGQKLFVNGLKQSGALRSIRWWPVAGGNETVLVEEAGLGTDIRLTPDNKWAVFSRQVTATAAGGEVGTLAIASTTAATNITNIDTNVGGFGIFANSQVAYIKQTAGTPLGELRRVVDVTLATSASIANKASPEGISVSRDGLRLAVLRDTDGDTVEELWTGRVDGTGWVMIAERLNIHVNGGEAFSPKGDILVWQEGIEDSGTMPMALMVTRIPNQGMPLTTQVGTGTSQWDFTDGGGLISIGEFPIERMFGGVLRIFDGMSVPGRSVQTSVGDRFAIVNDKVIFTIEANASSNGVYIVDLAQPPPMSTCDIVSQVGCSAGQSCLVQGTGDIAGCAPAGFATLGSDCNAAVACGAGMQCVNGSCRRLCEVGKATCPAVYPACVPAPGNARYGTCTISQGTTAPDGGVPP